MNPIVKVAATQLSKKAVNKGVEKSGCMWTLMKFLMIIIVCALILKACAS